MDHNSVKESGRNADLQFKNVWRNVDYERLAIHDFAVKFRTSAYNSQTVPQLISSLHPVDF